MGRGNRASDEEGNMFSMKMRLLLIFHKESGGR